MSQGRAPLAIVAAVARNGAIGRDNRLPWSMPTDLAHFRDRTMGKPMIMGRATFEAIGRVLPGRESIVVTRCVNLPLPSGVWRAADPESAVALAQERAAAMGAAEIVLAGGAALFEHLIAFSDRLHMTFIDLDPPADRFFPPIDPAMWRVVAERVPPRGVADEAGCRFIDYVRRHTP